MKYVSRLLFALSLISIGFQSSFALPDEGATDTKFIQRLVRFNKVSFLKGALEEGDLDTFARRNDVDIIINDGDRGRRATPALCWEVLHHIKAIANAAATVEGRDYLYLCMAKLYLSTHSLPDFQLSIDLPVQLTPAKLTEYLKRRLSTFCQSSLPRVKRWSQIILGLLYMDEAVNCGPQEKEGKALFSECYLKEALKNKGTRSVYVILAELYKHFFAELGKTEEEAKSLITQYLELAKQKEDRRNVSPRKNGMRSDTHYLQSAARPPYLTDERIQEEIKRLITEQLQRRIPVHVAAPLPLPVIQIVDNHQASRLPIRQVDPSFLERLLGEKVFLKKKWSFQHFDVSPLDHRCFFRSLGLNPDQELVRFLANTEDPVIRAMVANEIVEAWRSRQDLAPRVLEAMRAQDLVDLQDRLDLVQAHAEPGAIDQQVIEQERDYILTQVRERASSVDVFRAFITYQLNERIGGDPNAPYRMIAIHPNTSDHGVSRVYGLTSGDAIAYLNGFGLRVYAMARGGQGLKLIHEYIPQGATEIANVFYDAQALHFSYLKRIEERVEEAGPAPLISEHQDSYEAERLLPEMIEILRGMFPNIVNPSELNDDEVRYILYLNSLGYTQKRISEDPLSSKSQVLMGRPASGKSTIGRIINENGIREAAPDPDEVNRVVTMYLRSGKVGNDMGERKRFIGQILSRLGLPSHERQVTRYQNILGRKTNIALTDQLETEVCDAYRSGSKVFDIREATGLSMLNVLTVLNAHATELGIQALESPLKTNQESKEEQRLRIIRVYKELKERNPAVSVAEVVRTLGLSDKIVRNVLDDEGLVPRTKKSAQLTTAHKQDVIQHWQNLGDVRTKERSAQYERVSLLMRGDVSSYQVQQVVREFERGYSLKRQRGPSSAGASSSGSAQKKRKL